MDEIRRGSDVRSSALWGSGAGGGKIRDSRTRTAARILPLIILCAVAAPLVASAESKPRQEPHSFVSPDLRRIAAHNPDTRVRVIVQSSRGAAAAADAVAGVTPPQKDLPVADAVTASVRAGDIATLAEVPGLTVTRDAPVVLAANSKQLWPYASGLDKLWGPGSENAPAIAIVDSGIEPRRSDFGRDGNRVVTQVSMTSLQPNAPGDGRGHGTFVAGIAAGSARDYAGAVPSAKIVSLDVMDDNGMARTSDVIAAAQWILKNKSTYDIRVANFSLHSTASSSFRYDPLDKALEKLWFGGVVVVAAAGNYGDGTSPSGVKYAPANDPFVITVGAVDLKGSSKSANHVAAPWSAYGYTNDGFAKPELVAAGRYMIGPIPSGSTLALARPGQLVGTKYIQLSGTSFSAPVVSGAASQILARHPTWTPDQVKGALMVTARPDPNAAPMSVGVGELNAAKAAAVKTPPNPNRALDGFLVTDPTGDALPVFDAVSWSDAAKASVAWDSVSWSDVSWSDAAWSLVSWSDVSWSDVSWSDVSWSDVSTNDVSWSDADAGLADVDVSGGYPITDSLLAEIAADPTLSP